MAVGKVKWFDAKKGFGFIVDEEGEDVFVHYSSISTEMQFKTLENGTIVEYNLVIDSKGKKAEACKVL